MQAVLLAAGFGTRLRPLTDHTPKCLVPINGRPLLDIWLYQLSEAGVSSFFINTHYLAEQVEAYVADSSFRDRVTLLHEPELRGTLGTLQQVMPALERDFLVAHADNLCLCSWSSFIEAHRDRPKGCLMTMMTFETDSPSTCGIVEMDQDGRVLMMHEKVPEPPGITANAAVYLMSREVTAALPLDGAGLDISHYLIPRLHGAIYAWPCDGYLRDIGNPSSYQRAQEYFRGEDPLTGLPV